MHAAYPPSSRVRDQSPVSVGSSEWSGMNNYNHNVSNLSRPNPYPDYPRGDLATPPDPAILHGLPPRPLGPPSMEESRRRQPSEAGSQNSSRAASVANSRSSDGTISDQQSRRYKRTEMELHQHYTVLKNFLKGGAPQPPRPNKARDKLLRLSPVQFHELSTDVFDELQRRQAATPLPGRPPRQVNVPPFLQARQDFHEKRNQARQKLSSLQNPRFRDLSTDVFCELERRFPHFGIPDIRQRDRRDSSRSVASRAGHPPMQRIHMSNDSVASTNSFPLRNGSMPGSAVPQFDNPPLPTGSPTNEFARLIPKQFQSNTITPNKSTMVEDNEDDDEDGSDRGMFNRIDRSSDAFGLESAITSPSSDQDTPATSVTNPSRDMKGLQVKVTELESTLQEKNTEIENLKEALDRRLAEAQNLNGSLREEIGKIQLAHANREKELTTAHINREKELTTQIHTARQESNEDSLWKTRHQELDQEHQNLQARYAEQQKITEDVFRQGQTFLSEMRAMAEEGNGGSLEREESLQLQVSKLEEELKEWKGRYANAKAQASIIRTPSLGARIVQPNITNSSRDSMFRSPNGLIQDGHITSFQISIDELLQSARTTEPTAVLDYMRAVVIAVRSIALDLEVAKQTNKDDESARQRVKLTATANNMITACRNFAAAGGMSPVSLLDAAASHLSAAVVDLVKMVKMRPTNTNEDGLHDNHEVKQPLEGTKEPVNESGYFNMSRRLRSDTVGSEYSVIEQPHAISHRADPALEDQQATPRLGNGVHAGAETPPAGLGIETGSQLREDDTELQELKVYLENQTDLLVQTIQALVASIRNEEPMPAVNGQLSGILDVVDNVLSAAEGAMEDQSYYQNILRDRVADTAQILIASRNKLMAAGNDPHAQVDGPSSKTFTQRLPPLAFRIARETKDLVARIESVEASHHSVDEDYS